MKKLAFAMVVTVLGVSQVQGAVMVRTLKCTAPSSSQGTRVGVGYSVGAVSRSAISGKGTDYFLESKVVSPGAQGTRENLSVVAEQNGWLQLAGRSAMVYVNADFTAAKVDFENGYSSLCQ